MSNNVRHSPERTLLGTFLSFQAQINEYKSGKGITIDGENLKLPAVVAAARFPRSSATKPNGKKAQIVLSEDPTVRRRVEHTRDVIDSKLKAGKSLYGVNTGFGGSADTRTSKTFVLGAAMIQSLHIGVLPTALHNSSASATANHAALLTNAMPPAWIRGAIVVRTNTLVRGHSGVRWRLLESMVDLLNKDVVPVVPLRGSISASGDLSPLSYITGALIGHPNVLVHCAVPAPDNPPASSVTRQILPSSKALVQYGLEPLTLLPKEALGLTNGTSVSASVAALVAFDSVSAIVFGEICTAMGAEALLGTQANFASFISEVRPHPGQIEASATIHELLTSSSLASSTASQMEEVNITEDAGKIRQDRYSLRTAPQWIGPLIEDVLSTVRTVEIECNSTTDNPLIDPSTSQVHNGGNFQALALTTAFEKTRLAIFLLGKLLFSQSMELLSPLFNRGLPPNLAATDPSLNYHAKGLDVAMASYVSELGWLASNVGTHVQSAEMHNQAVNSIALISGRATVKALEVLNMLTASYLYLLCQAFDLRALQRHYDASLSTILMEELTTHISKHLPSGTAPALLHARLLPVILTSLDATTTMDADARVPVVISATTSPILDFLSSSGTPKLPGDIIKSVTAFRASFAKRGAAILQDLRHSFVSGKPPSSSASGYDPRAPAGPILGRTRLVYEYIRIQLGVCMHGLEHWNHFEDGLGSLPSIGENISLIYEALRDGRLEGVVAELFRNHPVHLTSRCIDYTRARL